MRLSDVIRAMLVAIALPGMGAAAYCGTPKISRDILIYPEGERVVDHTHIFLDGEEPRLTMDELGCTPVWTFYLRTKDGGLKEMKTIYHTDEFHIHPWENIFSKIVTREIVTRHGQRDEDIKKDPFRFLQPDGYTTYHKGLVTASIDGKVVDEVELVFNLLPSRPNAMWGELVGEFNWTWGDYYHSESTEFNNYIYCERADKIWVMHTNDAYYYNYSDIPTTDPFQFFNETIHKELNICLVRDTYVQWGMFYNYSTGNKYGDVIGDTVCTTDYITDPNILYWINTYGVGNGDLPDGPPPAGIETVNRDEDGITLYGRTLKVVCSTAEVELIELTDMAGRKVVSVVGTPQADLSGLTGGCYFARAILSGNRIITKKIMLR